MKKIFVVLPAIAVVFFLITGFQAENPKPLVVANPEANLTYPEDIQKIIDKSCFGCHNVDAQNDKSKKKLMWDMLPELSKAKIVATLGDIADAIGENEMPPEKFLEKYPDKALTEDEAKKLKEWAESTAEEMMK
ncbi:MAG: heme-binding domain-containing protein [Bacteroidales bacterium]